MFQNFIRQVSKEPYILTQKLFVLAQSHKHKREFSCVQKKLSTFLNGLDLIDVGNIEALYQLFDHLQVILE